MTYGQWTYLGDPNRSESIEVAKLLLMCIMRSLSKQFIMTRFSAVRSCTLNKTCFLVEEITFQTLFILDYCWSCSLKWLVLLVYLKL